jgi:methyl-accepting chemotaxis protein
MQAPQTVSAAPAPTDLGAVVAMNESAKAILDASRQVNLRALDAMVRGQRAGEALRGFAEVSSQMRQWSRELDTAIRQVSELSGQQVQLVSALVRQRRLLTLLTAAAQDESARSALGEALSRWGQEHERAQRELHHFERKLMTILEEIEQLGLMACVLARAAAIEAASGTPQQCLELGIVSKEFAEHSERIAQDIHRLLSNQRRREL